LVVFAFAFALSFVYTSVKTLLSIWVLPKRVESIKELQVIVDHFDKYPLISAKVVDYLLFKKMF